MFLKTNTEDRHKRLDDCELSDEFQPKLIRFSKSAETNSNSLLTKTVTVLRPISIV